MTKFEEVPCSLTAIVAVLKSKLGAYIYRMAEVTPSLFYHNQHTH